MISIKSLKKEFKNDLEISYKDITFETGKSYILLGASGCGKSTLLNMIAGVTSPSSGTIEIDGVNMTALSQKKKDAFRINKVGYIFQDFRLIEEMTVVDNIRILRLENVDTSDMDSLLDSLGILRKKNKKVARLSGGEKQRVAIVRALVKKPSLILADEPTGNLNFEIGRNVVKALIQASKGHTLIAVAHDERLVPYFDKCIDMNDIASTRQLGGDAQ